VAVLASRGGAPAAGSGNPSSWDLPRLGGTGRLRLADFRGKPTLVNFFASWCTQCEAELPGFAKVSHDLAGAVNFVGVNSLDDGQGIGMAKRFGIDTWPLAIDLGSGSRGELHDHLGGEGMPITAFYDPGGKLMYVAPGALAEPALRTELRRLFSVNS
jgi:thiol-disulfide isomerase/thioredoxin